MMRLAQGSTLFRKAFCAGPTCSPSRAALLDGHLSALQRHAGARQPRFLPQRLRHAPCPLAQQTWLSHGASGIQHEAPDGNVIGYDEVLLEPVEKNMYVKDPEAFDHKGAELAAERGDRLWQLDAASNIRFSHENPDVQALYREFLGAPLGEKSHHLLHTNHRGLVHACCAERGLSVILGTDP